MGYADDLQSIEAAAAALQTKANIVSGWCQYTGIEISKSKMRTFGAHWGVYKGKNPPLVIHGAAWTPTEVPMKMDGTMKSLGVKFDMHVDNQVQLRECIETVKVKGDEISSANGRRRDKMLAVGICPLTKLYTGVNTAHGILENMRKLTQPTLGW